MPDAVFIPAEGSPAAPSSAERLIATELSRGPWDPSAQHGGAPAALLVRAFERHPGGEDLILARVTYELLRPVPVGALEVTSELLRPGRRVQLLEASLRTPDGVEVMRARALKVQRAELPAGEQGPPGGGGGSPASAVDHGEAPPTTTRPADARTNDYPTAHGPMFATDAMDIRFTTGAFLESGPATAWLRLRCPLVAGEVPSSLQRLAAAADFGNGISAVLPWDRYVFINPDLTIYLEREPIGEWFLLDAQTRLGRGGIGLSDTLIYDEQGRVARAIQALLVTRRT